MGQFVVWYRSEHPPQTGVVEGVLPGGLILVRRDGKSECCLIAANNPAVGEINLYPDKATYDSEHNQRPRSFPFSSAMIGFGRRRARTPLDDDRGLRAE
jgi:hypothetical protein